MLIKLISNRSSMYGFLSRIYRAEVDQELLDQMARMALPTRTDLPDISEGYQMLKSFLDHITEKTVTDLAVDYAGIFLGAGTTQNCAYPYESVYTSPLRLVMQDARDQVLKLYRQNGLSRAKEFKEPEDHIAFELEFMSYLCQKTTKALKAKDKALVLYYLRKQKRFLEEHLVVWVPAFCTDVQRIARSDFYKAIARLTIGYLHLEQELIAELMDEIKSTFPENKVHSEMRK